MSAKEISAYLKQVIDLEQQLMQLRAVRDELALYSHAYTMVGLKPCYKMKQTYKDVRELVEWIDKPFIMNSNYIKSFSDTEDDIKKYPALFAVAGWHKRTSSSGRVRYYTGNAPSTSSVCADEIGMQESFFLDHYKKPQIDHNVVALLKEEPQPPVAVPMVKRTNRRKAWIIRGLLLLILSLLFVVAQMPEYLLFEIPCAVFLCWLADCFSKQKNKQADAYDAYLEQVKAYESAVEQREHAIETVRACLQQAYEATVAKASSAYCTFALHRDEALQAESNKIDALIRECEQTLRKLYSQDIIHSKYHNLTACCMFLEYLEAGRCEALTGANGAYNLYESELRQNLIIFKLDEVAERLDDLKSTMYKCCQAIESVRKQLNVVHNDMVQLNDTAQKQLKLSALTTVYAAATAANTSAIKYLTLIQ